jgi:hypothetical protein
MMKRAILSAGPGSLQTMNVPSPELMRKYLLVEASPARGRTWQSFPVNLSANSFIIFSAVLSGILFSSLTEGLHYAFGYYMHYAVKKRHYPYQVKFAEIKLMDQDDDKKQRYGIGARLEAHVKKIPVDVINGQEGQEGDYYGDNTDNPFNDKHIPAALPEP